MPRIVIPEARLRATCNGSGLGLQKIDGYVGAAHVVDRPCRVPSANRVPGEARIAVAHLAIPPLVVAEVFALAILIFTITLFIQRPLDFSAFPTILLASLMLRLSLNVASTRVVLLHGHEGTDAAGKVIEAFGEFVIGVHLHGEVDAEITVRVVPAE